MNNKKIKVALIGAAGRMGRAIIQVLATSSKLELHHALEKSDSITIGMDSGLNSGLKPNKILFSSDMDSAISNCDTVIDFSSPHSLESILKSCTQHKKPLVIGSTGIEENGVRAIHKASEFIPIVYSPNMSVGVNLLFKLVEIAGSVLKENFDIEVLDIHHKHKKDSPSGTAVKLKDILLKTLDRKEENVIYGRRGIYNERPPQEIAIHTMRAGEVVGEHTVFFLSPEERIEIKHSAQDRKTFAVGAVKAAEFVTGKSKGLFDMFDVLGL